MQSQTIAIFVCLTFVTLTFVGSSAINLPQLCEPSIIEDMPTHIKKVCIALENSSQLTKALNAYISKEAAAMFASRGEDLGATGTGIKRTDVDHVFLRFGRRR